MVKIWVISDTHFGHARIIEYCNRPFKDAYHMNEVMIERWNEVVQPHHHVYHLGDVAASQVTLNNVMPRLNGHKRLLLGNHDNHAPMKNYIQYFDKIMLWRKFDNLIMTHLPLGVANFPGKTKVNVHGHIHDNPSPKGPYINACVEWLDYRPISLDELIARGQKLEP